METLEFAVWAITKLLIEQELEDKRNDKEWKPDVYNDLRFGMRRDGYYSDFRLHFITLYPSKQRA